MAEVAFSLQCEVAVLKSKISALNVTIEKKDAEIQSLKSILLNLKQENPDLDLAYNFDGGSFEFKDDSFMQPSDNCYVVLNDDSNSEILNDDIVNPNCYSNLVVSSELECNTINDDAEAESNHLEPETKIHSDPDYVPENQEQKTEKRPRRCRKKIDFSNDSIDDTDGNTPNCVYDSDEEIGQFDAVINQNQCPICNKQYKSRLTLCKHLREIHETRLELFLRPKNYRSAKRYRRRQAVSKLVIEKQDAESLCHICAASFKSRKQLRQHYARHKAKTKQLLCSHCPYVTYSNSKLQRHTRLRHTGERPYQCQFCEKRFCTGDTLFRHENIHTKAQMYRCTVCNYRCVDRSNMKKHALKCHQNAEAFTLD